MVMEQRVERALKNIDFIIANTALKREEHTQLLKDILLIKQRCSLAEKLELKKE